MRFVPTPDAGVPSIGPVKVGEVRVLLVRVWMPVRVTSVEGLRLNCANVSVRQSPLSPMKGESRTHRVLVRFAVPSADNRDRAGVVQTSEGPIGKSRAR